MVLGPPPTGVTIARIAVDVRHPPEDLDALIDWFDGVCQNLVLLEPYALSDLRGAVERFRTSIRQHISDAARVDASDGPMARIPQEHLHFRESLDELGGLLTVVEREDHGGHRQALGQYGRVLTEVLRDHRGREGRVPANTGPRGAPARRGSP